MLASQGQNNALVRGGVFLGQQRYRCKNKIPRFNQLIILFMFFAVIFLILPAVVQANPDNKEEVTATTPGIKAFAVDVAPVWQLGSHLSGGGSLAVNSLYTNATFVYQLTEHFGTGFGLFYNISQYRFSGTSTNILIPLFNPWGTVQNYGIGIPLIFSINDTWQFIVSPAVQYFGENGANWGSAIAYGGLATINYNWGVGNYINIGVAGFQWIAETDIFPYFDFNWHISKCWRLSTTLQSSPVGPGGVKLSYQVNPHWEIGIAGGYRFNRFRLDKHGSLPNGIGQYEQIPVVGVITYNPLPLLSINVFGGFTWYNKVWMETSNGDGIYKANQRNAPIVGFNITGGIEPNQFRAMRWQINKLAKWF
jgi:hypothetical protein